MPRTGPKTDTMRIIGMCAEPDKRRLAWSWQPRKKLRIVDDDFFEEGDAICRTRNKQTVQDEDPLPEEFHSERSFACQLSGCAQVFDSVSSYEHHYNTCHRHKCSVCARVLPTSHLLSIHVLEWHDSMFHILAQKQHMFECLVAGCGERFTGARERKDHLVRAHKYPSNFRFDRTHKKDKPSKKESKNPTKKTSKGALDRDSPIPTCPAKENRVKDSSSFTENAIQEHSPNIVSVSTLTSNSTDTSDTNEAGAVKVENRLDDTLEVSEQNIKAASNASTAARPRYVYKVPTHICFGAGSQKGFQRSKKGQGPRKKHWHQRQEKMDTSVNIEHVNMDDLAQALDT